MRRKRPTREAFAFPILRYDRCGFVSRLNADTPVFHSHTLANKRPDSVAYIQASICTDSAAAVASRSWATGEGATCSISTMPSRNQVQCFLELR